MAFWGKIYILSIVNFIISIYFKWLSVVGVTAESAGAIEARIANIHRDAKTSTLDILKGKSDYELHKMLMPLSNSTNDGLNDKASAHRKEDQRRLSCALDHLRKYTNLLLHGQTPSSSLNMNLFWDSWWDKGIYLATIISTERKQL